nr:unnamed protein product [Spirometra erinaceieuropaei]
MVILASLVFVGDVILPLCGCWLGSREGTLVSASPVREQKMGSAGYFGCILFSLITTVGSQTITPDLISLNSSSTAGERNLADAATSPTGTTALSTTDLLPTPHLDPSPRSLCPKCYGESVCVNFPNGSYGCHCPPEYSGPLCATSIPIFAESCNRHVCQNGAGCLILDNRAQCLCPENYVGLQCNRVAVIFEVRLHLHSESHVVDWFDAGGDQSDNQGGNDTRVVCDGLRGFIRQGVSKDVAVAYAGCRLHHMHRFYTEINNHGEQTGTSGMDAEVHLLFDPGNAPHLLNVDIIGQQIRTGYLASALSNPSLPKVTWDDSLVITAVDHCKTGHHDCSDFATCHSAAGSYTCSCNSAYTDKSRENGYLPGRMCSLHGGLALLVGCLVMTPFVVGAVFLLVFLRRRERQRFWIFRNHPSDVMQLVDSARYPMNL